MPMNDAKRPRGAHFADPSPRMGEASQALGAAELSDNSTAGAELAHGSSAVLTGDAERPRGAHFARSAFQDEEAVEVLSAPSTVESSDEGATMAAADRSSSMLSVLVIISRVTGFLRTTIQAWALGAGALASAYTVADQMPNVLYELVVGGMLITSFLPVYVKVKKKYGERGASEYTSNLLSIVMMLMILLTVLCFVFAAPVIFTQSAGASSEFDFDRSVWFFRWFSCEVIFYALSSIISGVLNAERDYYVSNVAPILNNVIVISMFLLFGFSIESGVPVDKAVIILAIGNPLGVFVQAFIQIPALRRHGIKIKPRIDLHDPMLRDTLSIGLPTLVVTLASFPTTAVMSSCALSVTPAGASIAYYARVWYVLPFSVFAIPISVTLFTELSDCFAKSAMDEFKHYIELGLRRVFFTLIPLAMLLMVFSSVLISVFTSGRFTAEAAALTAGYLAALAPALPFYGVSSFLQKVCSSMLSMKFYAFSTCIAAVLQIVICLVFTPIFGLYVVPISSTFFYGTIDIVTLIRLRKTLGPLGLKRTVVSALRAFALGLVGVAVGGGILFVLSHFFGPCQGMLRSILYAAAGGLPALVAIFGTATALGVSEAPFFDRLFAPLARRSR